VLSEFQSHYRAAVDAKIEDERERQERLRVSSFPYCPLRHAYTRMTKHERANEANFGSFYYTEVGTVTHDIIQNFFGRSGKIYGAWVCRKLKCKGKREFSSKDKCPICKGRMRYVELTVKAFKNVSGHLDGIWRNEKGEWFVIDYKTSSVRVIMTQKKNPTLPYHHNVAQIKAYCALIELMFDIEITGWILMYVARDNPMLFSKPVGEYMSAKAKKKYLKKIKGWDRDWDRVINMTDFDEVKELIAEKPCDDHDDYVRQFDSLDPCPLSQGGLCFQKKKLKSLMKIVWDERPASVRLG
jgi:hypothetical protein